MVKVMLSYHFPDEVFARRLSYFLRKHPQLEVFCWGDDGTGSNWPREVTQAVGNCDVFVWLWGDEIGHAQAGEIQLAQKGGKLLVPVKIAGQPDSQGAVLAGKAVPVNADGTDLASALPCAREIVRRMANCYRELPSLPAYDGLPLGYPFAYEKDIIKVYREGEGKAPAASVEQGCPPEWPCVVKRDADKDNPIPKDAYGYARSESAGIVVDAGTAYPCDLCADAGGRPWYPTFPEAGPREKLYYPQGNALTVGILVSGGIAPGVNAVLSGIVSRHYLYCYPQGRRQFAGYNLTVRGYLEGFKALLRPGSHWENLTPDLLAEQAQQGGSYLKTSRAEELLAEDAFDREKHLRAAVQRLDNDGVNILYVVGGDGSMKAAHAMWTLANEMGVDLSIVGVPKTMDNDILWVWQAFGFLSAVEKAREALLLLHTEVTSNPRLCVIQLFGSDSGFVVSHAALASGVCDAVLVPEVPFTMTELWNQLKHKLQARYQPKSRSPWGLVVMAETAIPQDVEHYLDSPNVGLSPQEQDAVRKFIGPDERRVTGQTPDELRSAGLKIVSRVLQKFILDDPNQDPYWKIRVFTNEPRHLLRAIPPSVSDVIFGQRLGTLAVDGAMAGYTDFMVSQWLTEYVLVPLPLVVLGRKRVPPKGMFWRSVVASIGRD